MSDHTAHYSIGRAFPLIFISFFLGGVWGATIVPIVGIFSYASRLGETGWHVMAGGTLILSLYYVQKVAGRVSADADVTEAKWCQIDGVVSVVSFATAYILAWIIVRETYLTITNSIVI